MEVLITFLIVLAITLGVITLVGHGMWVLFRSIFRLFTDTTNSQPDISSSSPSRCQSCNFEMSPNAVSCEHCGCWKPEGIVVELLKDLASTDRQIQRFHRAGTLDDDSYQKLKAQIDQEKLRLESRGGRAPAAAVPAAETPVESTRRQPVSVTQSVAEEVVSPPAQQASSVTASFVATDEKVVFEPTPSFRPPNEAEAPPSSESFEPPPRAPIPLRPPRRLFAEMLNSFMEESNIRWGEIVGGLLIIGCSTALVVSLWSQISQIPVLKFLIFTTVTAVLFGIGLYTEHRWKLPTTSRGILTTATLLVPLNFLAIAAVSAGTEPHGAVVIGSELIAPAVFLCLVYFAGRVLTPAWPHLLAAGVLGSSVGQLLIRHFVSPELSPGLLVALGAFPVVCYVASDVWMLKKALADREIDEHEAIAIFVTLGALTFAAVLPFALVLYKSGPVGITMMYLAPLVSLAGFPLLATGTLLWQRILSKELVASRTAGTSIAILGVLVVLLGMVLAWPNPASIVPAALFNFAVFTTLAVLLKIPRAHLPAAFCFSLAYIVLFHVMAGHVAWQNLRETSLLLESLSFSSGQALAPLFVVFLVVCEWLARKRSQTESESYLIAAGAVAVVSLALVTGYGVFSSATHPVWFVYAIYAFGAFWIAFRKRWVVCSWIGSALLLAALSQAFAQSFSVPFPWQTAMLSHATVCAIGAILTWRYEKDLNGTLTAALFQSALLTSFAAVVCLVQAGKWETTAMQAERVFWLAGIWLVLLWSVRRRILFAAFQIALTCATVLAVKAVLQQYEWYAYLPNAFLHPRALQIQGTVLILLAIGWSAARFAAKSAKFDKLKFVEDLLDSPVDRLVSWAVLIGFVLLAIYGALPGVTRELTAQGLDNSAWNIAGFPHQEAFGVLSWILLGFIVLSMIANAWERRRAIYLLGAMVALSTICPLLAGRFETDIATASAWRWLGALFLLTASLPILFRDQVFTWLRGFGWPPTDISDTELARRIRLSVLGSTLVPLIILTAYPALRAIYYMPVQGPASGFFHFLDDSFSYGAPLVVVALVIIGYALHERLPVYAFAAGLFFNVTVTMSYLLSVVAVNGSMDRVVFAQAIQLNAITTAIYVMGWLVTRSRWLDRLDEPRSTTARDLLKLQVGIAVAMNAVLIAPVGLRLVMQPGLVGVGTVESGSLSGWAAFLLTVIAAALFAKAYRKPLSPRVLSSVLIGVACLAAFTAARWDAGNWAAFHALMAATAMTGWLMCLARSAPSRLESATASVSFFRIEKSWFTENWEQRTSRWATILGALTVLLALRGAFDDPTGAAWSIGALFAISALAVALNWQTYEQPYLFATGILFNSGVSLWWDGYLRDELPSILDFICLNVVALGLTSILCLWLELRSREHRVGYPKQGAHSSFHHFAALGALGSMSFVLFIGFAVGAAGITTAPYSYWLGWLAIGSSTALMIACLWDSHARYAVAGLYALGLLIVGMALQQMHLPQRSLAWSAMMTMAIYTIGASLIWRSRKRVMEFAANLKIPRRIDPSTTELKWLAVFNSVLVAIVLLVAYWVVLTFADATSRLTAALAVTSQSLTFALLAAGTQRAKWQRAAIAMFVTGTVFVGWAWLVPGVTGTWLNRAVILMVEMFAFVGLYALGLNRALQEEPDWIKAARDCIPWIAGTGVVALLFALSTEVFYQINFGAVRIKPLSLIAIGATLVAGIGLCVLFALSSKHDPLNLSERGRMNYVYAGEVMLGLLFMHIRLTMPWLFTGFFQRYWPFVVMAIAYFGVAASEALRRRQVLVLAQPIERTGAFLPLLPVIGFWVIESKVDFSALLFVVGGIYGLLSILRRSFVFGLAAAIAGNAGLWYMLHRTDDYQFLQHPQIWLIPVALSVLLAAYLNEDDFTEDQMAGIRYMSLVMIYASSTADIFVNGVAESPWLPMVLAALSLAGVFGGIVFRIRGLLLLGCVFLLIAIITMIWYASANLGWTWLWWLAGIATGVTIIFMFALFEKKRAEVLRVVEGFKDWDR